MKTTQLGCQFNLLRYAVVVSSGMTAGASLYLSTSAFDAVLKAPTKVAIPQWEHLFDTGKVAFVVTTLVNGAALGTLAFRFHRLGSCSWKLYAAAAVLGCSVVPFTRAIMWSNIQWLKARCGPKTAELSKEEEEEAQKRLIKWRAHNVVRTVLFTASFATAAFAALLV